MNVLSYTLFRTASHDRGDFYEQQVGVALRGALHFFRGWRVVIHHDASLDEGRLGDALRVLHAAGDLELCRVSDRVPSIGEGMLWRLRPAWRPGVEAVACRDIDALTVPREVAAVEAFLERSDKPVHVIHDAPVHRGVMGGTTTFRAEYLRDRWRSVNHMVMVSGVGAMDQHGADQDVLNALVDFSEVCWTSHLEPARSGDELCGIGQSVDLEAVVAWFGVHGDQRVEACLREVGL